MSLRDFFRMLTAEKAVTCNTTVTSPNVDAFRESRGWQDHVVEPDRDDKDSLVLDVDAFLGPDDRLTCLEWREVRSEKAATNGVTESEFGGLLYGSEHECVEVEDVLTQLDSSSQSAATMAHHFTTAWVVEGSPDDDDEFDIPIPENMTETDAQNIGAYDGQKAAEEDTEFFCDPFEGQHYYLVNAEYEIEYLLAFCRAYGENYEIEVFRWYAFMHGEAFGAQAAAEDVPLEIFIPTPVTTMMIPDPDVESYTAGYLFGYVREWEKLDL